MKVIGSYSFILLFIGFYYIEEIESIKGKINEIIKYIFIKRDFKKLKKLF